MRLLRLIERPRDRAVLAPLVVKEILWLVASGPQGGVVRQLGLADSGLSHVARAVRWIREHYAQPFRVEEVARLSGMSVSAFYRNFQAVTAMSPIQFQKQIRLQEARLLLATGPATSPGWVTGWATTARRSSAGSTAASSGPRPARTPWWRPGRWPLCRDAAVGRAAGRRRERRGGTAAVGAGVGGAVTGEKALKTR